LKGKYHVKHIPHDFLRKYNKKALILVSILITGCGTVPRSDQRQAHSDSCWSAGHGSAWTAIIMAPIKPLCILVDQTAGQTQSGASGTQQRYITPVGTYHVNRTGTTTTITQTAK
jgi:hypothetical protein